MIKGFFQDKDTYLGSIVNLIWANNLKRMDHLHEVKSSCGKNLENKGGRCDCKRHTFLRGNRFEHHKYVDGDKEKN